MIVLPWKPAIENRCNGPTDRPTDRRTDIASYRVACTRLKMMIFQQILRFLQKHYQRTDRPTDRPTDGPTDRPTDIVSYRVACTRLKKWNEHRFQPKQSSPPSEALPFDEGHGYFSSTTRQIFQFLGQNDRYPSLRRGADAHIWPSLKIALGLFRHAVRG